MTDKDFLLSVLEDGEPHSQAEILRRSFDERGCGLTVHSRIAELREEDHFITCERVAGATRGHAWVYRLLSLSEPSQSVPDLLSLGGIPTTAAAESGRGGSESEQEELFTYQRSPEWA